MNNSFNRILVVDDDPSILRILKKILEKHGYEVHSAGDCASAITQLEKVEPHFFICDWELPDGTGIDLVKKSREMELSHYIHVMMLTSRTGHQSVAEAMDAGADEFVSKPIERAELLARLRSGQRILDLEARLSSLANQDPLTGLNTRRYFNTCVGKEIRKSRRYLSPLSCVILDIDFFKKINDTHGHPVGDEVLKVVAKTLEEVVREMDFTCRYGGEEFCVLLPETDLEQAKHCAERMRQAIAKIEIPVGDEILRITSSFGAAQLLAEMEDEHELIEMADQCLLTAKNQGRNCVMGTDDLQESLCQTDDSLKIFEQYTAKDAMTSIFSPLTSKSTISDVAEFFLQFRISSAPVIGNDGSVQGIISEKDMINHATEAGIQDQSIQSIMRTNVVSYTVDTPLIKIWEFLKRVSIRSVVVIENNQLLGVVGRNSLLRWFYNSQWSGKHSNLSNKNDDLRKKVKQTASQIENEAHQLEQELQNKEKICLGSYIGRASRIQELTNDLLSASTDLHSSTDQSVGLDVRTMVNIT